VCGTGAGADPGILESWGPVRGRSPEPSADRRRSVWGFAPLPFAPYIYSKITYLEQKGSCKDRGIIVDEKIIFREHINEKISIKHMPCLV